MLKVLNGRSNAKANSPEVVRSVSGIFPKLRDPNISPDTPQALV